MGSIFQVNGHPNPVRADVFKDPVHHDWEWSWESSEQIEVQCLSIATREDGNQDSLLGLFYNLSNTSDVRPSQDEIDQKMMIKDCRLNLHEAKGEKIPRAIPRIILSRARLSEMTLAWDEKHAPTRQSAIALKRAIEETADTLFFFDCPNPTLFRDGWKHIHAIFWSLDCKIMKSNTHPRNDCKRSLQHAFFFKMNRTRQFAGLRTDLWETDLFDLEAVLSMWVWSLRHSLPTTIDDSGNSTNAKLDPEDLQCYRIISSKSEDAFFNLEPWFDFPNASGYRQFSYGSTKYEPIFGHASDGKPCWIFRNNSLDLLTSNRPNDDGDDDRPLLFSASLQNATVICAQKIYTAFFRALLQTVLDIGGLTQLTPDVLLLDNTKIETLCDIFPVTGLGDRQDALSCIIPALFSRQLLPSGQVLSTTLDGGERFLKENKFREAKKFLRWSYLQVLSLAEGSKTQTLTDPRSSTEAKSSTKSGSSMTSEGSSEKGSTSTKPETDQDPSDVGECAIDLQLHRSIKGLCECLVQQVSNRDAATYFEHEWPYHVFFDIHELLQDNINLPQNWETIAECARTCIRIFEDHNHVAPPEAFESKKIIKRILSRDERRIDASETFTRDFGYLERIPGDRIR